MYADVGRFGPNPRIDSTWSRFSINLDIFGLLSWPKLSIFVRMATASASSGRWAHPTRREKEEEETRTKDSNQQEEEKAKAQDKRGEEKGNRTWVAE